ncbi:hypothetical protein HOU26_gp17 [Escherichia phage IMM-002]|uniref:Uncharacterized protein n=1 Tax=Escherichia phage IMM-002 TaxID=2041760 RepID=A0A384WID6_9CAUD|nr:hypothetical protein HOU26_gp17 [Escherichia phage IMM-002]ATI16976.1 hypothetical protein [Escherichia phage IMM-002]
MINPVAKLLPNSSNQELHHVSDHYQLRAHP